MMIITTPRIRSIESSRDRDNEFASTGMAESVVVTGQLSGAFVLPSTMNLLPAYAERTSSRTEIFQNNPAVWFYIIIRKVWTEKRGNRYQHPSTRHRGLIRATRLS